MLHIHNRVLRLFLIEFKLMANILIVRLITSKLFVRALFFSVGCSLFLLCKPNLFLV